MNRASLDRETWIVYSELAQYQIIMAALQKKQNFIHLEWVDQPKIINKN